MAKKTTKADAAPTTQTAPEPAKPAAAPQPSQRDQELSRLLGEVTFLMTRSPSHRHAFVADLEWAVIPPLALSQCRLFRNNEGNAIAFISWATVSDAVNERLKNRIVRLQPGEWRSGPHPWILDVIAPYGGAQEILASVEKAVFEGKKIPIAGAPLPEAMAKTA